MQNPWQWGRGGLGFLNLPDWVLHLESCASCLADKESDQGTTHLSPGGQGSALLALDQLSQLSQRSPST